jgi:hypothetical protein
MPQKIIAGVLTFVCFVCFVIIFDYLSAPKPFTKRLPTPGVYEDR